MGSAPSFRPIGRCLTELCCSLDTARMHVELVTLDAMRDKLRSTGREALLAAHPGAFLLAMGFLSVEAIRAGQPAARAVRADSRDQTAAITFGTRLRHAAQQRHPMAGCAFYMRPTPGSASVTVGRSAECDITIPDAGISEQHCRIEVTDRGVVVVDTQSTNGTSVNLDRLDPGAPQVLADEDILSLGRYSFQLLSARTFVDQLALLEGLEEADAADEAAAAAANDPNDPA